MKTPDYIVKIDQKWIREKEKKETREIIMFGAFLAACAAVVIYFTLLMAIKL